MHGTPIRSISDWASHLRAMGEPVLAGVPYEADETTKHAFVRAFRDEYGARGSSVVCVLAWSLGVVPDAAGFDDDPDTRLWTALLGSGTAPPEPLGDFGTGLVAPGAYAIEHRTLIELAALHALTHIHDASEHAMLDDRLASLVDWHTRELQPDNGVNRPWAIHAFAARSIDASDSDPDHALDAMLHAQTLAHNCCVMLGKPDLVSAIILRDAADWLDARRASAG